MPTWHSTRDLPSSTLPRVAGRDDGGSPVYQGAETSSRHYCLWGKHGSDGSDDLLMSH